MSKYIEDALSQTDAHSFESKEKVAQLKWIVFILMFFLIQAVIWTIAISITATDQSHAVVEGYDLKALNWDEQKLMVQKSNALGWQIELNVDSTADIFNTRTISLVLNDAQSQPISDASISLRAFHRGRAAEVQVIDFVPVGPGVYSSTVRIDRAGKWQFAGEASFGTDRYIIDLQQIISVEGK